MTEEQRKQYINIIDYIGVDENNNQHNEFTYKLSIDFIQSDRDKYVVVRKLRLVNPQGQLDVGCSCRYPFFTPKNNFPPLIIYTCFIINHSFFI